MDLDVCVAWNEKPTPRFRGVGSPDSAARNGLDFVDLASDADVEEAAFVGCRRWIGIQNGKHLREGTRESKSRRVGSAAAV